MRVFSRVLHLLCWLLLIYASFAAKRKNYYDILGVSRTASDDEIKAKFKRLAVKEHPDKSDRADAAERFAEIREAYETLSDSSKRRIYDHELANPNRQRQQQYSPHYNYYGWRGDPDEDSASIKLSKTRFIALVQILSKHSKPRYWAIKVYSMYCSECHRFSSSWDNFVSRVGGFMRTGRVIREEEQSLVQNELRATGFAVQYQAMMVLLDGGNIVYKRIIDSKTTTAELVDDVSSKLLQIVPVVSSLQDYEKFLSEYGALPHFLFVTDKTSRPNLLQRYIAKEFSTKAVFAHVYINRADVSLKNVLSLGEKSVPVIMLAVNSEQAFVLFESHQISSDFSAMEEQLEKITDAYFQELSIMNFALCIRAPLCVLAVGKNRQSSQSFLANIWGKLYLSGAASNQVFFAWVDPSVQKSFLSSFEVIAPSSSPNGFSMMALQSSKYATFPNQISSKESSNEAVEWVQQLLRNEPIVKTYPLPDFTLPVFLSNRGLFDGWVSDFFPSLSISTLFTEGSSLLFFLVLLMYMMLKFVSSAI